MNLKKEKKLLNDQKMVSTIIVYYHRLKIYYTYSVRCPYLYSWNQK